MLSAALVVVVVVIHSNSPACYFIDRGRKTGRACSGLDPNL
jgi:hypothetical protein